MIGLDKAGIRENIRQQEKYRGVAQEIISDIVISPPVEATRGSPLQLVC